MVVASASGGAPERDEIPGGRDVTTEPREQQEPSMEEILSSIRRIIADEEAHDDGADDELGAAEARSEDGPESLAREPEDDDEDVLELTRVVRESGEVVELQTERSSLDPRIEEPERAEPAYSGHSAHQKFALAGHEPGSVADQKFALAGHQPGGVIDDVPQIDDAPQIEDEQVPSEKIRNSELVSGAVASMATGAFAKLSQALQRTPEEVAVADASGRTVEQFVEDIARPMLKEWLDENLPAIIERLVQKEIQKISRRAELN
jgi:hypothetical protein